MTIHSVVSPGLSQIKSLLFQRSGFKDLASKIAGASSSRRATTRRCAACWVRGAFARTCSACLSKGAADTGKREGSGDGTGLFLRRILRIAVRSQHKKLEAMMIATGKTSLLLITSSPDVRPFMQASERCRRSRPQQDHCSKKGIRK